MSLPNPAMSFSPFAILTAAEMNDLVDNIEALADGSGLDDGAVTPSKIDLGIVRDGGTGSTTSTSYGNLSTSATVTTTVSSMALVLVDGTTFNNTNGAYCFTQINVTGANTTTAQISEVRQAPAENNQRLPMGGHVLLTGLSSGSTTFTVQTRVTAGEGTWTAVNITVIPLG